MKLSYVVVTDQNSEYSFELNFIYTRTVMTDFKVKF